MQPVKYSHRIYIVLYTYIRERAYNYTRICVSRSYIVVSTARAGHSAMEDSVIGEELLRAAMCDDFSDVKRLFTAELRNYADPDNGKTIMHAACQAGGEGNLEMVQWLKEHGVDLETKNEAGRAPIQEACEMGNLEIVQYMHAQGAAVNVANMYGINSVHQ